MRELTRREFVAGVAAAALAARVKANPLGLPIGSQTYPHRQMISDGDFAGLLKDMPKLGLWLGGGFNYTFGTYGAFAALAGSHDIQFWAFAMLTMEKLLQIPLVPFVRAGITGDVFVYSNNANVTGGALGFRFGGGIHYYIIKQVGLGMETNFTVGPGFYPAPIACNAGSCVGFYGNWDFMFGARFAF